MNFLKVAGRDISSIFKNRFIRVSVVAIIIVPLLYSLLYLAAFWDPYSKLESLPVAIVNMDSGATQDGKEVNFGNDIVDNLKENSKLGWRFVSFKDAEAGVKGDKYYGMFVIPENFSKNALSAKDGKPQKPEILFQENEKRNFLAAQINGKVTLELQKEISKNISDEYVKVTFDSLYEVKDGMQKAADGSGELKDGIKTLSDQVPEMKNGVGQLYDGSTQLNDGLNQARNGAVALYDGSNQLNVGLNQAKNGAVALYDGSNQLNAGLNQAKSGVAALYDGSSKLNSGIGDAQKGAGQINQGLAQTKSAVSDLYSGSGELINGLKSAKSGSLAGLQDYSDKALTPVADGIGSLDTALNKQILPGIANAKDGSALVAGGVNTLIKGMSDTQTELKSAVDNELMVYLKSHQEAMTDPNMQQFLAALNQIQTTANSTENQAKIAALQKGANDLNSGLTSLYSGVTAEKGFQAGLDGLNGSMPTVKAGLFSIYYGIKDKDGNLVKPGLEAGFNSLIGGANTINGALGLLNGNNPEITPGVPGLYKGSGDLVDGLNQLYNGSASLKNGIAKPEEVAGLTRPSSTSGSTLVGGLTQMAGGSATLRNSIAKPEEVAGLTRIAPTSGSTLFSGLTQMASGSATLKNSIAKPGEVAGLTRVAPTSGSTLFSGITQLTSGSTQLKDGLGTLNGKMPELQDGATKLLDGSTELNTKLKDGADKITGNLKNSSSDMAEFVSSPLIVNTDPINPVKDYGTGFTPYFIPLSLWVGALMMFFIITDKVDDDINASPASVVLGKFLSYGFVGLIQAVLASTVVLCLGLKPNSIILYYLTNILMSYVFIAIMQCLIFLLGQAGRLLSIVLLILQLTSSGGTFPLELVPKFFKVLNPFAPFTYCTQALREVISGVDYSVYSKDISILVAIMVAFLFTSVVMKGHADKVQERLKAKMEAAA